MRGGRRWRLSPPCYGMARSGRSLLHVDVCEELVYEDVALLETVGEVLDVLHFSKKAFDGA